MLPSHDDDNSDHEDYGNRKDWYDDGNTGNQRAKLIMTNCRAWRR